MPAARFDRELLMRLMIEHPKWSNRQYADALTAAWRVAKGGPAAPAVTENAVVQAKRAIRPLLAEQGILLPPQASVRVLPWAGIPAEYRSDVKFRYLRALERIRLGTDVGMNPKLRRQALNFESHLRSSRTVVDVTLSGQPFLRPARGGELDEDGELVKVCADPSPEWLRKVAHAVRERGEQQANRRIAEVERLRNARRRRRETGAA